MSKEPLTKKQLARLAKRFPVNTRTELEFPRYLDALNELSGSPLDCMEMMHLYGMCNRVERYSLIELLRDLYKFKKTPYVVFPASCGGHGLGFCGWAEIKYEAP